MISQAEFFGRARYTTTAVSVTIFLTVAASHSINATSAGLNVKLGSARQLPIGKEGLVVNDGANSFNLIDNGNTLITVVAPGECVDLAVTDNSTAAGAWWFELATVGIVPDPPVNLYFYLLGGFPSGSNDTVQREYNSQLDAWTQRSDIPSPVASIVDGAAKAYGAACFYVGGIDDGSVSGSNHKRIYHYDPDVWTQMTSGTVRWGENGAAKIGTSIGVFNGSAFDSFNTQEYVVGGDSWTARTARPAGRRATPVSCGEANSKAVLTDGTLNAVDTYVFDTWTARTARPGADARRPSTTSKSDICYVYGGGNIILANVYAYDESVDSWSAMTSMSSGRMDAAVCNIGGFNYIAGGKLAPAGTNVTGSTATITNANWEHDFAADTYLTRAVATPTSGSPTGVYNCMSLGAAVTP